MMKFTARLLLIAATCLLAVMSANAQEPERRWTFQLAGFFFRDGESPLYLYGRERNGEWVAAVGSSRSTGNANKKTYNRSYYYGDLSALPIKDGKMKGRMVMHMTPDAWIPFDHKSYTIEIDVDAALMKDKMEGTYKVAAVNTNDKSAELFKGKSGKIVGESKAADAFVLPAQVTLQLKLQGLLVGGPPSVGERCLVLSLGYDGGKIVSAVQGQLTEKQASYGTKPFTCTPDAVKITSDGFKGRVVVPGVTLDAESATYTIDPSAIIPMRRSPPSSTGRWIFPNGARPRSCRSVTAIRFTASTPGAIAGETMTTSSSRPLPNRPTAT